MPNRQSCNVSLTPELEEFITASLASGDYADVSDVMQAALRLLRDGPRASTRTAPRGWPTGGGECGELIRTADWSVSRVGLIENWSLETRATVANIVNSPIAKVLMWGPDHVMIYNDAYRAIAGERHPMAMGTSVAVAFPEVWDWNRPILQAGLKGETVFHRDQPIVFSRPDGPETLFLDLFYTPVYDADAEVGGVMCTIVDNSAGISAETRLMEREAELRRVTDAVPMLISYVDRDHVYRFANAAYQDWFNVVPETMIGRHVRDTIGEAAYENRRIAIDRGLAGETFSSEMSITRADGTVRRLEVRYVPHIETDGSVPGVHILGIDMEERAQREAAVSISNSRFRTAMDAVHGVTVDQQPRWPHARRTACVVGTDGSHARGL